MKSLQDARLAAALRTRVPDAYPLTRKALFLSGLALTLGLVVAAVIGWTVPGLRKAHVNLPIGVAPLLLLVALLRNAIYDRLLPTAITSSWHAVGLLLAAFLTINGSLIMQAL